MRISALIAASTACLCMPDLGVSGGLGTTPSQEPAPEQPAAPQNDASDGSLPEQTSPEQSSPRLRQIPVAPPKAKTTKAAEKKAKKTADTEGASALAATIATALTSGECSAVVWVMPGHEVYRPNTVVIVDAATYGRLRDRGHARDCEKAELEAAIAAGSVHWDQ